MKTAQETEAEFIRTLQATTGRGLAAWMKIIDGAAQDGTRAATEWLKTRHKLNHTEAFLLASIHENGGKPKYGDTDGLLDALFARDAALRDVYLELERRVMAAIPGVRRVPMKSYVALNVERDFLVAVPKAGALRVGMDLGDHPLAQGLTRPRIPGAMPRFSHMLELKSTSEISATLMGWIARSCERSEKRK